ncbi:MAG: DUF2779 domain-containing protein [Gemmatimonadales bacterium]|nr:DUF2779 domain-containing protein [Gemmatimonadales bacterium]
MITKTSARPKRKIPKIEITTGHILDGAQCGKKQFMGMHMPDFASPVDEAGSMLAEEGREVERLARQVFPEGIEILGRDHGAGTLGRTRVLRRRKNVPQAMFRPAFRALGTTVRPKIMVHEGDGVWGIIETSSSTRVKEEDMARLAIVIDTLQRAKVKIGSISIVHPNPDYTLPWHRTLDPREFFLRVDVAEEIHSRWLEIVPEMRKQAKEAVKMEHAPQVPTGSHCNKPHPCPFTDHCKRLLVPGAVEELNNLRAPLRRTLKGTGRHRLQDVPLEWVNTGVPLLGEDGIPTGKTGKLSRAQQNQIEAAHTGEIVVRQEELAAWIESLPAEKTYLDFEAYGTAIPREAGHKPYQVIPFQFSAHIEQRNGRVYPNSFLHAEGGDPRMRFTEHLVDSLPDKGAYLVWSPYEASRLKDLCKHFYRLAVELGEVLGGERRTASAITNRAINSEGMDQSLVAQIVRLHGLLTVREHVLEEGADHLDEIMHRLDPDLAITVTNRSKELMECVHEDEIDALLDAWDPVLGTSHFFEDLRQGSTSDLAFTTTLSHWHAEFLRFAHGLQKMAGPILTEEEWPHSLTRLRELVGGSLEARRYPEANARLKDKTGGDFRNADSWARASEYVEGGRLVDMLEVQRELVYHPDQKGSHSIKTIVKTQIPGFGYDDLEIRDGATAQMWFLKIVKGEVPQERLPSLCTELIRYCERDTESEIRILSYWKGLVRGLLKQQPARAATSQIRVGASPEKQKRMPRGAAQKH